ncbi:O-antigen ligase family protein [Zavarzinia compransoris]|nr:O-antigen ligase family protein [Zavarzinia compransoris]TDP45701.1 O-antigen ligase-like membrane protein [Zavarzinia compransoris]
MIAAVQQLPLQSAPSKPSRWPTLPLVVVLSLVVALSPLPFASNAEVPRYVIWSIAGCAAGYASLLAAGGLFSSTLLRKIALPGLFYGGSVAWMLLQAGQWGGGISHPLWRETAEAISIPVAGSISVNPSLTIEGALDMLAYGIFGLVAVLVGSRQADMKIVLYAGLAAAVCNGLFGIGNWLDGNRTLFGYATAYPGVVTGTFTNRNNFASYCGLWAIVACALAAHLALNQLGAGRRARIDLADWRFWILVATAIILLSATALTLSRGGLLASLLGLAFFALALVRRGTRMRPRASILLPVTGLVMLIASISIAPLSDRLQKQGLQDYEREAVIEILAEGIANRPLVGTGFGAFEESFRLVRDDRLGISDKLFDKAHNLYLEFLFGLGLPGALSIFAAMLAICCQLWPGMRKRSWANSVWPALGLAAILLASIHSLVDFSFQIPAIAICLATIVGFALAQATSRRLKA